MKETFHIQWHITNLCNLHCAHCYQDHFSTKSDVGRSELQKISDNLLTSMDEWEQETCIHLTGGEPLLKPELFDLLSYLNQQPRVKELGIITNGLLLDRERVRRLSDLPKLKKVKISMDGADAETNDAIRSEETFEKIMDHISSARDEKRFEIILMFTAMKRNFRSLPLLLNLCRDHGIDGLIIERFIPLGKGRGIVNEVLGREEWKEMIRILFYLFSIEGGPSSALPYQAFQIRLDGEEPELLGAPCVVGVDGLCIMPQGDVFPCRRLPISIGNLLATSLKQIWEESDVLERLRRKRNLKGKCGTCKMDDCRGCRSLAFALTHDYLAEDPHCGYPNVS
ncbi:MAG TPA: radical SAM protein [Thermodesulfobacteriota bacterium]|nr:radical SAM protein [Thermodesulfobacteriota bacterium]